MATITTDPLTPAQFQLLATWFSPSFPIGAFSYSHGLEAAFEAGVITDRQNLSEWLEGLLSFGSGRNDAILFAAAYRSYPVVGEVRAIAAALTPSKELRTETINQGEAFVRAIKQGWPDLLEPLTADTTDMPLPVAAGVSCAASGIPLEASLIAYLHAFAANIVSAALRCMPVGQSDGIAVIAATEPFVTYTAKIALASGLEDLGSATPMLDWFSATHEIQYSRLFRS